MRGDLLIIVASWEERFAAGVERSLGFGGFESVLCLASERYKGETQAPRDRVARACTHAGVTYEPHIFDFEDQVVSYRQIEQIARADAVLEAQNIVFDISTAPRSTVWLLLNALRRVRESVVIRYNRALDYATWQTAEEGEPKLIINRSGIMYPDLPTCVVMLCGPEISRAEKLCYRFEPKKALILRDTLAHEFGEVKLLPPDYRDIVSEHIFDNKSVSINNIAVLDALVSPYLERFNVVAASFGPKLGSLALFELSERHPQIALSYVTSGQHNLSATQGIGEMSDRRISFETDATIN